MVERRGARLTIPRVQTQIRRPGNFDDTESSSNLPILVGSGTAREVGNEAAVDELARAVGDDSQALSPSSLGSGVDEMSGDGPSGLGVGGSGEGECRKEESGEGGKHR